MTAPETGFLPAGRFGSLLDALGSAGYAVVAPQVRDGAIVFAALAREEDMACAVVDEQAPGSYRLQPDPGERRFAWATGAQALKPLLFAPQEPLWRAERGADGALRFVSVLPQAAPTAVIGVRACDLAALALHDAHFLHGPFPDPAYAARRARLLLVAVNCARSAASCFCVSTGDGPHVERGHDVVLTELTEGFLLRAASGAGRAVLERLSLTPATADMLEAERSQRAAAASGQHRRLPGRNLRDALLAQPEHPRWAEVAERCLACGNCTSVCPTCFCHAETDVPALGAAASEHRREWDSCFTGRHSHMHGYRVRPDVRPRYRQWLTHKLATWHDQYGRSGCVGCGRCVTWCPVGIDITEEAAALVAAVPP